MKGSRLTIAVMVLALTVAGWAVSPAAAEGYDDAVAQWKSYKDVGAWLDKNFKFDNGRQADVLRNVAKQGPSGLRYHSASSTFASKTGYCVDSAKLALDALGRVNPEYNPRWIFIRNAVP
ncbi:MAG: hypothetical protein OQJ87_04005, partial [Rhodospirillales bacterium]|nr:hypothetical protein [Rhodospirillales bacterium]